MHSLLDTVASIVSIRVRVSVGVIIIALMGTFNIFSQSVDPEGGVAGGEPAVQASGSGPSAKPARLTRRPTSPMAELPDSIVVGAGEGVPTEVVEDEIVQRGDSASIVRVAEVAVKDAAPRGFTFNPDPMRAVWMSALCPGLGQLYNRRYWKLPIVIGGYMGLGYATSWNNTMLRDYTTAYSDIMDNDPTTRSYMDFFPPTVKEEDLDKNWLSNVLRVRKNLYRRNRDLCIISMIGVYLLAMVDAYVDAELAHFDISPNLSVDLTPTLMAPEVRGGVGRPGVGVLWAFSF